MTKDGVIKVLEKQLIKLYTDLEQFSDDCIAASVLDMQLKRRKTEGEVFTKDSPEIVELMRLYESVGYHGSNNGGTIGIALIGKINGIKYALNLVKSIKT